MADELDGMTTFVAVAEAKGFRAAGDRLGVTHSAVSQSVRRLEERLGVALVQRTTIHGSIAAGGRDLHAVTVWSAHWLDRLRTTWHPKHCSVVTAMVRQFLPLLLDTITPHATTGGKAILAALEFLHRIERTASPPMPWRFSTRSGPLRRASWLRRRAPVS